MNDPAKTLSDEGCPQDEKRTRKINGISYEWDEENEKWRPRKSLYGLPEDNEEFK